MKRIVHTISSMLILMTSLASIAPAQNDAAQALKNYLGGRKFLVTYRQGGPVYGTYFFLEVDLYRPKSEAKRCVWPYRTGAHLDTSRPLEQGSSKDPGKNRHRAQRATQYIL